MALAVTFLVGVMIVQTVFSIDQCQMFVNTFLLQVCLVQTLDRRFNFREHSQMFGRNARFMGTRVKISPFVVKDTSAYALKCKKEELLEISDRLLHNTFLFQISVLCLTTRETDAEKNSWNFDHNAQYHVQTDEGPERYFRFQTLNGQYRKEKRLVDGTVIGTEGWLDPLGYFRLKDYIADDSGFRILR